MKKERHKRKYLIRLKPGLFYTRRKLRDGSIITPGEWTEISGRLWRELKARDERKMGSGGTPEFEFKEVVVR